jgi:hypothetical protein
MTGDLDLEQRYRRVLRLLPGYYRDKWEEDMVAAFLDGWLTGDPDEDSVTMEYDRPGRQEVASVAGLAARLYLGGAGAPRRYFAWGQAVRGTVLAVLLADAIWGLGQLVLLARSRHLIGWLPPPPAGGFWSTASYVVGYAWVVVFVALVLGDYRTARIIAALVVSADLAVVLHGQLTGVLLSPFASWAHWFLIDLAPVLAKAAFHRDAPPAAPRPWLLALPAGYVLVYGPLLALQATGNSAWLPDFPGLCCVLVALACLAHAPVAWSRRAAGTGPRSLALAGAYRIVSLAGYLHDPHLISVSLAELLIVLAAAALVAPDAARSQAAAPAPPRFPHAAAA